MADPVRARGTATYADLVAAPEHLVAEILDGDLITSPRPAVPHGFAASMLGADIGSAWSGSGGGRGPGGWWILYEPELHIGGHVIVPDLAGWRQARMPVPPNAAAIDVVPDWVCEIQSPATARVDRVRKMPVYATLGVGHLWMVDPLARTLEVYRLEDPRWVVIGSFGGDDRVRPEPFEAVELELSRWWLPEAPGEPAP